MTAELRALVEQERERFAVPGVAVVVVAGGETLLCEGFGLADLGSGGPVTADTAFAISSNTKAFTAGALARLAGQGQLDLDAPVRDVLPGFALADPSAAVTSRDLLAHRTGMSRHDLVWAGDPGLELADVARVVRHLPMARPFREGFLYTNLSYDVAGHVTEVVAGRPWRDAVTDLLLAPLGMTSTGFSIRQARSAATPYRGTIAVPLARDAKLGPSGCMVSTAADLERWLRALLGESDVLDDAVRAELFRPAVPVPGVGLSAQDRVQVGYGLGWHVEAYRGRRLVRHGGSTPGWTSGVYLLPDEELGVAVLCNADMCGLPESLPLMVLDQLLGLPPLPWGERYADQYAAVQSGLAEVTADREPGRPPTLLVAECAGVYEHPAYGELELIADGDGFRVRFHELDDELSVRHRDRDAWELVHEAGLAVPFQLLPDFDGHVTQLRAGFDAQTPPVVLTRRPPVVPGDVLAGYVGSYSRGPLTVTVTLEQGALQVRVLGAQLTLVPVTEQAFSTPSGPVVFAEDAVRVLTFGTFARQVE